MIDRSFGSIISCLAQIHCSVLLPCTSAWFVRCTVQFSKNHRSSSDLISLPHPFRFVKCFLKSFFKVSFSFGFRSVCVRRSVVRLMRWYHICFCLSTGFFFALSGSAWPVLDLSVCYCISLMRLCQEVFHGAFSKREEVSGFRVVVAASLQNIWGDARR